MKITILTLFPEMFDGFLTNSIIKRAIAKNLVEISIVNIRDYTKDKYVKNVENFVHSVDKSAENRIILPFFRFKTYKQCLFLNIISYTSCCVNFSFIQNGKIF